MIKTYHFVYIEIANDAIETGVQTVKKVDDLQWGAFHTHRCKANNITEVNRHLFGFGIEHTFK